MQRTGHRTANQNTVLQSGDQKRPANEILQFSPVDLTNERTTTDHCRLLVLSLHDCLHVMHTTSREFNWSFYLPVTMPMSRYC